MKNRNERSFTPLYYEYKAVEGYHNLKSKCKYYDDDGDLRKQTNISHKNDGFPNVLFLVDDEGYAHSPYDHYYPVLSFHNIKEEYNYTKFYFHGRVSRFGGPAVTYYDLDNNLINEEYYLNGNKLEKNEYYRILNSREDFNKLFGFNLGKYYVSYDSILEEEFVDFDDDNYEITVDENNFLHSYDDNSAWSSIGYGDFYSWYSHGVLHRIVGPAEYIDGDEEYYINGIEYKTRGGWEIELNRIKFLKEL